jgi:SulP family sulfate permease
MYFALMGVMKYIPLAVFSSILISVAINMSRFPLFIKLAKFGIRDVIILVVTCALTIIFDLTYGVIGGVIVTFIVNAKNFKTGLKIEKSEDGTLIAKGTIFFVNANKLCDRILKEAEDNNKVTVDFSGVERIDETATEKLSGVNKKLRASGKTLELINFNDKVSVRMSKFFEML